MESESLEEKFKEWKKISKQYMGQKRSEFRTYKWPYSRELSESDMNILCKDLDYSAKWGIGNVIVASEEYGLSAHYRLSEERNYKLLNVNNLTEAERERIRNICP